MVLKLSSEQLAVIMPGNEMTLNEIAASLQARYPGLRFDSNGIAETVKAFRLSALCQFETGVRNRQRTYKLVSVAPEFFIELSGSYNTREKGKTDAINKSPGKGEYRRRYWNNDELPYIQFANDFDRLLRNTRD